MRKALISSIFAVWLSHCASALISCRSKEPLGVVSTWIAAVLDSSSVLDFAEGREKGDRLWSSNSMLSGLERKADIWPLSSA